MEVERFPPLLGLHACLCRPGISFGGLAGAVSSFASSSMPSPEELGQMIRLTAIVARLCLKDGQGFPFSDILGVALVQDKKVEAA